MAGRLVIVPCGSAKIWDKDPHRGPTPARDAYVGSPFTVNRAYAEQVGDAWVILSAKYGFIKPDFPIPGPYNVTFKRRSSTPISVERLREQIAEVGLDRYDTIVVLGGQAYRQMVEPAFAGTRARLQFPFSGLPLGKALQATKRATLTEAAGI